VRRVRRLPRWAAVASLIVVAAVSTSSPLAAQQEDEELRVFHTEGEPGEEVTLLVTTPPAVIGAALPPSAFAVYEDGRPVPADVAAYPTDGLEIALVLGARSTASLDAEQEAGAEFVRFLGRDARIAVVDASGPSTLVPMTDDGEEVVQAFLDVENAASSDPTSEAAVEAALDEFSDDARRRAVVLMTDDDGAVSPGLAARLVDAGASLLYIQAAVDAEPVPSLVDAAAASGGRSQQGDLQGLIRTVDQVRADLDNQYRIRYQSTGAETVEVQVTTAGGVLSGTADLTTPPPTVPPRDEEAGAPPSTEASAAEDEGGGGSNAAVAVVVVLLLLAAAVVAGLFLLRRRRSTGPPAPTPVVLDLRETPPPPGTPSSVSESRPEPGG
jgi:hypothetical protein